MESKNANSRIDSSVDGDALLQERLQRCQTQSAGTELDLSNLELTEIPVEVVTMFPSLRRLNLRNNRIEELPSDFARLLSHLVVLNVSDNKLTQLPDHFGSLRHLQKLLLANNQLHELPVTFSRLISLEELNLSGNDLQELEEEIGSQLVKLKTLDLSRNTRIREIPASFGTQLPLLRVVDLRGCDALVTVPEKIRRLHERNFILHSRAKRRELISRALRVRQAVDQTMLNAAIVSPTAAAKKATVSLVK